METNDNVLRLVEEALASGDCGRAIQEMETYLTAWPEPQTLERLMSLKDDYDRMVDFWRRGVADPGREDMYRQLTQRMYVLYANVAQYHQMKSKPYQQSLYTRVRKDRQDWSLSAIRQELEDFVSSVALLQLESDSIRQKKSDDLYGSHQRRMSQLFEYVLTSRQWSEGVGSQFAEMMVSPTVDSIDQQLIVSAVTLSLLNRFDISKWRMLTAVYERSADEEVRQRALVGWVLTVSERYATVYPEQRETIERLLQRDAVCQELSELQVQLVYCLNEERDSQTIRQEIMPDLMSNSVIRINSKGMVEENDDDPLEDILHPDAADERMERLEASVRRMSDMQKQGADIYFGGFSKVKRFPFFYEMSNWLVPFYMQHPDIPRRTDMTEGSEFMERLVTKGPFCNSDKYSFILALQEVFNRLPDQIRQLMKRGEASWPGGSIEEEEQHTAAYIRRLYLMDLYRFFRLFPHREEFPAVFDRGWRPCFFFSMPLFADSALDSQKHGVVRMLRKQGYAEQADEVVATIPESLHDVQFFLWTKDYDRALQLVPDHEQALSGKARQLFNGGDYRQAAQCYDRLSLQHPEKSKYALYRAVCLVRMEDYEEALRMLYKLNYEQPDDAAVSRALAWTLMCSGRLEQAERIYRQLTEGDAPDADDRVNYSYCLWLQGRVADAAEQLSGCTALDVDWLRDHGISGVEIKMMQALIRL